MEGCVVAEGAAAVADFAVPVGACESCVNDKFLQAFSIDSLVVAYECVVSFPSGNQSGMLSLTIIFPLLLCKSIKK